MSKHRDPLPAIILNNIEKADFCYPAIDIAGEINTAQTKIRVLSRTSLMRSAVFSMTHCPNIKDY